MSLDFIILDRVNSSDECIYLGEVQLSEGVTGLRVSLAALMLSACNGVDSDSSLSIDDKASVNDVVQIVCDTGLAPGDTADSTDSADALDTASEADTDEPHEPVPDNQEPWPTSESIGANLAGALTSAYSTEPSGVIWVEEEDAYFVVGDGGDIGQLTRYGVVEDHWDLGGDLEDIVYGSNEFFVADELDPGVIRGFDVSMGAFTDSYCSLTDLPVAAPLGLEGLAFIPAAYAPLLGPDVDSSDPVGVFVAGTQASEEIRVYPASLCEGGSPLTSVATFWTTAADVSGIHFNPFTQRLYVLHDSDDSFDVLMLDGTWVQTYDLPFGSGESTWGGQEGITLGEVECGEDYAHAKAELIIADDQGGLYAWTDFPVACQWPLSTF